MNDGRIEGRKSVNVPKVNFQLPSLSEKDKGYVRFSIEQDVDFIAHSFVRNKEDVLAIQAMLDERKSPIKIIAKIENQEGVDHIDEILDHVYGVMVARGDLAIEIPYERIPGIQKMLINKCISRRKPVIIATQMLHSMIRNPRPTRAEVSDIANAIYGKTDAIMLSGETASGQYPLEAVTTMATVAAEVEKSRSDIHDTPTVVLTNERSAFLTKTAVEASLKLNARAIIADTSSGIVHPQHGRLPRPQADLRPLLRLACGEATGPVVRRLSRIHRKDGRQPGLHSQGADVPSAKRHRRGGRSGHRHRRKLRRPLRPLVY